MVYLNAILVLVIAGQITKLYFDYKEMDKQPNSKNVKRRPA